MGDNNRPIIKINGVQYELKAGLSKESLKAYIKKDNTFANLFNSDNLVKDDVDKANRVFDLFNDSTNFPNREKTIENGKKKIDDVIKADEVTDFYDRLLTYAGDDKDLSEEELNEFAQNYEIDAGGVKNFIKALAKGLIPVDVEAESKHIDDDLEADELIGKNAKALEGVETADDKAEFKDDDNQKFEMMIEVVPGNRDGSIPAKVKKFEFKDSISLDDLKNEFKAKYPVTDKYTQTQQNSDLTALEGLFRRIRKPLNETETLKPEEVRAFLAELNKYAKKDTKEALSGRELGDFAHKFGLNPRIVNRFLRIMEKPPVENPPVNEGGTQPVEGGETPPERTQTPPPARAPRTGDGGRAHSQTPMLASISLGDNTAHKTYTIKDNVQLSKQDFASLVFDKIPADELAAAETPSAKFALHQKYQDLANKFMDEIQKFAGCYREGADAYNAKVTTTEAKLAFARIAESDGAIEGTGKDSHMSDAELEKVAEKLAENIPEENREEFKKHGKEFLKLFIEAVSKTGTVGRVGDVSDPGEVVDGRHQDALERYMQSEPNYQYVVHDGWSQNRVIDDILVHLGIPADQITPEDREWMRNQLQNDENRTYPFGRNVRGYLVGQVLNIRIPIQQDITRESELDKYRNRHRSNRTVQGGGGGGRTDNTPRQQDNVTPQPQPVVVPGGDNKPCDSLPEGQASGRKTPPNGSDTAVTDPLNPNGQRGSVDGGQGQNQDGGVADDYRDEETDLLVKESVTNHDLSSVRLATSLENANPGQEFRNNHSTKKISSDTVLVTHDGKEYALRKEMGKKNKSVTYKYMDKENPQNVVETVQMELKDKDETKPTKITTTDANGTRVQERKYDNDGVIKSLKEKNQAGQVTKEMIKDEDGKCWLVNYTYGTGNTRTVMYYSFDPARGTASEQCSKVVVEDTNGNNIVRRSTFDRDKKTVFEESFTDGGKRYNGTMLFNNVEVDEQTQMPKKVNGKYVSNDYQKAYYDESKKLFIRVTCKDGIETTIDSEADKIKPKANLLEVECPHPFIVRKKTLATGEIDQEKYQEQSWNSILAEKYNRTIENGLFHDIRKEYDKNGQDVVSTTEAKQFVAGQSPQTIKHVQTATKKGDPEETTIYFYDKDGKKLGYATRRGNQDRYYVEGSTSEVLLESDAFKKVLENTVIYKQAFDSQELKNPAK